jgi:hypothetical protein
VPSDPLWELTLDEVQMVVDNPGGVQLGSGMFEATVNSLSLVFVNSLSILRFKNYKYMFLLNSGIKYIYWKKIRLF